MMTGRPHKATGRASPVTLYAVKVTPSPCGRDTVRRQGDTHHRQGYASRRQGDAITGQGGGLQRHPV